MLKLKSLRPEWVTLLASAYLLIGFNSVLWEHVSTVLQGTPMPCCCAAFGVLLLCAFNIVLTLLAFRKVLKPVLATLFIISAGVAYFMSQYGVLIDIGMLRNTVETNVTEVRDLLSLKLFVHILLLGVIPTFILLKTPIRFRSLPRELLQKLLVVLASAALLAAVAMVNYQGWPRCFAIIMSCA